MYMSPAHRSSSELRCYDKPMEKTTDSQHTPVLNRLLDSYGYTTGYKLDAEEESKSSPRGYSERLSKL